MGEINMIDLKSNLFFKSKFTIELNEKQDIDILWAIICEIKLWMNGKFNINVSKIDMDNITWTKFKYGCSRLYDLSGDNSIYAESIFYDPQKEACENIEEKINKKSNEETVSWACRIVENQNSQEGMAPRTWVTEIGYQALKKGVAEISYVITFSDQSGFIGACEAIPDANVPRVISALLNKKEWKCKIGNDIITTKAIRMKAGDFPKFKDILYNKNRKIPIIYVSPRKKNI